MWRNALPWQKYLSQESQQWQWGPLIKYSEAATILTCIPELSSLILHQGTEYPNGGSMVFLRFSCQIPGQVLELGDKYLRTYLAFTDHSTIRCHTYVSYLQKQTPWPLVHKQTMPTEQLPLVDEIWCQLLWIEGCHVVSAADPLWSLISVF
jgi:hypothetical protein